MGKYSIMRQDGMWVVRHGWSIVYYSDSKQDCVQWCLDNP